MGMVVLKKYLNKEKMTASFELYNLKIEIDRIEGPALGRHKVGDYFEMIGEDIFIPEGQGFSIYAMSALLPLLPAKQRMTNELDWMSTDWEVADPDPNFKAIYKISRTGKKVFTREETTLVEI